jgi:perosamine synthetase
MNMIPLFKVRIPNNLENLYATLSSGFVAEGPRVIEFEQKISKFVGTDNVLALNSGTSALHLALVLSNVKPGDFVITTPITSPATNISIINIGAFILWADVDPITSNILPESVDRLMRTFGSKVKAVITVDWGGLPSDIDSIKAVLPDGVSLIQDAAHSLGGIYKGDLVGSLSADFTTFSFQAIKHITTGDGGLLCCKSDFAFERGKRLRWFGIDRNKPGRTWNDDIQEIGFKFHMNDIAASIGIHQLDALDFILNQRRRNASTYIENIKGLFFQLSTHYENQSAYWLFTIFVDRVEEFMEYMKIQGITAFPVHIRNDTYTGFLANTAGSDELPGVINCSSRMCCIPVGEWLTELELSYIIDKMNKWLNN